MGGLLPCANAHYALWLALLRVLEYTCRTDTISLPMTAKLSDAAASLTRAAHRVFSEMACDAALILKQDGIIEYANEGVCELLQAAADEHGLRGQSIFSFVQDSSVEAVKQAVRLASEGYPSEIEIRLLSTAGDDVHLHAKLFWDSNTKSLWFVGHDLSQVREIETQLRQLATHDVLTGLPNRAVLAERLDHHVEVSTGDGTRFAAIGLDLDGFKRVNDALGHVAGDELLKEIASRIKSCLRDTDTVSRTGGDEFFMILQGVVDEAEAAATCARVLEAIRRPVMVQGHDAYVSASMGVAMFPEHGNNSSDLIQHADLAMYLAKNLGKNRIAVFEPELKASSSMQMSLESSMHSALSDGQFLVYYQPLVDPDGVIHGCEALLRWRRPDGTWISPAEFIPVAESSGLITVLGDYVLRSAAMQLRRFDEAGLTGMFMSVNVSPRQLRNPNFEENLQRVLKLSGLKPERLVLEITENMLMGSKDRSQALLSKIAATGVRFSLDDFGTGYSCLAYLKTYPISALKIDRSFLAGIETDEVSRSIVQAILDLARALKLYTVVEGVETQAQADVLKAMNADYFQGYLYGRPVPPNELLQRFGQLEAA